MSWMPFGADTLIVPFEIAGRESTARIVPRMSRMRPAGELFRSGHISTSAMSSDRSEMSAAASRCTRSDAPPVGGGAEEGSDCHDQHGGNTPADSWTSS